MTCLPVEVLRAVNPMINDRGYPDSRNVVIPDVRQQIRDTSLLFSPLPEQRLAFA